MFGGNSPGRFRFDGATLTALLARDTAEHPPWRRLSGPSPQRGVRTPLDALPERVRAEAFQGLSPKGTDRCWTEPADRPCADG